ncbi:energy transducer TonB [candidate division KSB1 bacterium]|nr:energy transducer TonB [candidate division KSB1 bacterium]
MKVNPKVNIKLRTRKLFEVCLILSLAGHIFFFLAFKEFASADLDLEKLDQILEIEDIPETEQLKKPPPPSAPAVPIESEDEDLMDDITIDDTEILDFSSFDAPPPPPPIEEEEIPDFLPLENQPKPIGGIEGIRKLIKYPEIARKAGIQGQVVIHVLVNEEGVPVDTMVLQSLGNSGCDEAAIDAIMKTRFTPATQRGRAVKFWMSIPITFQLKGVDDF